MLYIIKYRGVDKIEGLYFEILLILNMRGKK